MHEGGYRIEGHASGALRFRCPEGKVVPHVPSRPRGDAHEPARRNRRDGLVIDSETCVQERAGERMTLHWVVNGLVDHDPRLRE